PVWDTTDIRMNRNRHHPGAFCSLGVERFELILGAAEELLRLVMLNNHHGYIVQLHGIGEREKRAMGCSDFVGLVVIDPVSDVLKPSFREKIESLRCFGETGTEPARRCLSRKLADSFYGLSNRLALIFQLVHRFLDKAVAHELPTGISRSFG